MEEGSIGTDNCVFSPNITIAVRAKLTTSTFSGSSLFMNSIGIVRVVWLPGNTISIEVSV